IILKYYRGFTSNMIREIDSIKEKIYNCNIDDFNHYLNRFVYNLLFNSANEKIVSFYTPGKSSTLYDFDESLKYITEIIKHASYLYGVNENQILSGINVYYVIETYGLLYKLIDFERTVVDVGKVDCLTDQSYIPPEIVLNPEAKDIGY